MDEKRLRYVKMKDIVNKLISINFDELNNLKLNINEKTGLVIDYKNCKYEFIIHLVEFDTNLVILGSSFLSPQQKEKFKNRPYFERQSWFKDIKHNVIYYNDPTVYDYEEINGGWGIGTPDNWHLENIAEIIKKLSDNIFDYDAMKIPKYGNLFFYGSSMGGFMSIVLSTLIENSTSIADSPQLNLFTWWYWDELKKYCFKGMSDEEILQYSYRLDIMDLINTKKVIPNSYIILDCTDQRDWDSQNRNFLNRFDSLPYYYNRQNNNINLHFVGKGLKHYMLSKSETLNFIDNIIKIRNDNFNYNPIESEMLTTFKELITKIFYSYENKNIPYSQFIHEINFYFENWNTCRLDVKNIGTENNSIEIIEKDGNIITDFPQWFKDQQGTGCVVSSKYPIHLKIRCLQKGNFSVAFKGPDYRYREKRYPVHICYNNFKVNNKLEFSKDFLLWHNLQHIFSQKCEDNEIIDLKIEFKTINDYFPELASLIDALNGNEENLKYNFNILIDYINNSIKENNLQ